MDILRKYFITTHCIHMQISFAHVYYDFYLSLTLPGISCLNHVRSFEGYFHECAFYKSRVFAALHFAPTSSNTTF